MLYICQLYLNDTGRKKRKSLRLDVQVESIAKAKWWRPGTLELWLSCAQRRQKMKLGPALSPPWEPPKVAVNFLTAQIMSSGSLRQGWERLWGPGKGRRGSMARTHFPHPLCPSTALGHIHHSHLAVVPNPVWQEDSRIHWDLSEWG